MKLSNFKNAFGSLARMETSPLVLNPALTLDVVAMDAANRSFTKAQGDFARANPKHQIITDNSGFTADINARNITPEVIDYIANVLVTGWTLLDDSGKEQSFSPAECVDLLTLPDGIGARIAVATLDKALTDAAYIVDWESVVTKNS